jgi:predicted acyltransferase (DUF342 family)
MELGANNLNTGDLGIIMTRHGETGNVAIVYDESQDVLNVGYTLSNAYENTITMDTANSLTLQVNGALNVGSNIVMDDTASNVIEVSGNVKTDSLFLGNFEVVASQGLSHVTAVSAATNDTVYLNNPTTGLVVDSNVEVGGNLSVEGDLEFNGNLTMNTITVQTLFTLDHVVSQGNTTANTVQFTNATTALTATGNVEVGGELSVSGDVEVGGELSVSANVEVGTANLFVDTTTGNVGVGTTNPQATLHVGGTDGMIIPSGTTAQQPTGQVGMVRYNASTSRIEYYNGNWVTPGIVVATGGTVSTSGDYKIHTFTESNNFVVTNGGTVEYLMVGGGGSGSSGRIDLYVPGGGGGGGGVIQGTITVSPGTYSVGVGDGGAAVEWLNGSGREGNPGSDTTFNSLIALGGGRGRLNNGTSDGNGGSGGGSGGGGSDTTRTDGQTSKDGGYGLLRQGHHGGKAYPYTGNQSSSNAGGGGGGAGVPGGHARSATGGNGGNGLTSSISGTSVTYGGGGGGAGATAGSGGLGGGGSGSTGSTNGGNGTANTGGGGGGNRGNGGGSSGAGGSGIVIIRYVY